MPPDPQVIATLVTAVAADPESNPLRLHLASLLLDDGRASDALPHLELVLSSEPGNVEALLQATRACESLGDPRAEGYRQEATSLSMGVTGSVGKPAAPPAAGPGRRAPALPPHPARPTPPAGADPGSSRWRIEEPRVTLADVIGFAHVKRRLNVTFLAPLRNPELREAIGPSVQGGLLLFGPPNCGKTFIARALAGELEAHFLAVELRASTEVAPDAQEGWAATILDLAQRHAPTVIFFDGVDAAGSRRRALGEGPGYQLIDELMTEMDHSPGNNHGVYLVGATDRPWDIEAAMLRPGRFDRTTLVLPPDRPARVVMLQQHLADRLVENLGKGHFADRLDGYSVADILRLCDAASWLAASRGLTSGTAAPITEELLTTALELVEPTSRAWFETARNFALFANQSGMYDDLVTYMRSRRMV